MFADCRLYCRYIVALCTVILLGLLYTSPAFLEKDSVQNDVEVKPPSTCSINQEIARSRVRDACEEMTESYTQVSQSFNYLKLIHSKLNRISRPTKVS